MNKISYLFIRLFCLIAVCLFTSCITLKGSYIEDIQVPDYYKTNTLNIKSAVGSSSSVYLGNGYLLTCAHAVHKNDNTLRVNYKDEILLAAIVKYNKKLDLALLKVDKSKVKLNSVVIAQSDPQKYETLHAIGYFHGLPDMLRVRTMKFVGSLYDNNYYEGYVVPGFSGGPVFNSKGELVAVSYYKHNTYDGQKTVPIMMSFTNKAVREFLELPLLTGGQP